MDDKPLDGWSSPVYHAMAAPSALLMAGVPQTFLICNVLGTLLLSMVWWRALAIGLLLHVVALVGTQYEVQWLDMFKAYRRYASFYEG